MKYIYFLILLISYSCSNSNVGFDLIPIVKSDYGTNHDNSEFSKRVDLSGTELFNLLKSQNPEIKNLTGLGKFVVEEMDSSKMRPFDLYLLESNITHEANWHLVTIDKINYELISEYVFSPEIFEIRNVFPHSSELDHDGISVQLVEDKSNQDSINIYSHSLEVFETGKIKFISKSDAISEVFKILTSKQTYSGTYVYSENNVKVNIRLKDGPSPNNYSYNLNISTPEGCIHTYQKLDCRISANTIEIDTIDNFKLVLNDEAIIITNNNFESGCEDIFELNFKLEKTDDNM